MDNLDDWRKAGKITGQTLSYGRTLIKKGASYLEVTEKIEKKIYAERKLSSRRFK